MDFALDDNQDVIIDNDIVTASGNEELDIRVGITLRTRLGEFEPADEMGLDDSNMYGKQVYDDYLTTDIMDALSEQVPEIEITKIEIGEPDEFRVLDIDLEYNYPDGSYTAQTIPLPLGGD